MIKIINIIFIKTIKLYQYVISPLLGNNCRYFPSCSEYFIDSLNEHGAFKGTIKGTKRILSCHPIKMLGGGSGLDPVKKNKGIKNGH